jgi:Flp pilus assembly pilin Flp
VYCCSTIMRYCVHMLTMDKRGVTALEYAVMTGLMAVAIAAGARQIGLALSDLFNVLAAAP